MQKLLEWLKRPWFAVLIGLLLLSLLIWFAGPYFAFADFKPFESSTVRLVAIVLLVLAWVVWLQLRQLMAARTSDEIARQVAAQPQGSGAGGATAAAAAETPADAQQLRERFAEAVAALKKSRKSGANLYELPWYVIIGPPGSGKTTAIANSGLHFPLAQKYGSQAVRGIGGTRNCDWWFTDEAVLLDTAGRYTTQDSDRSADAAGWIEFLRLLKRYRRRRPVNGVIIALSAAELMTQGEAGLQAHVQAVRARLDEINQQLGMTLPVYVLFSKCDLIAGFSEYFDDLDSDARKQVWGTTFPLEATYAGKAAETFGAEFDLLLARVQARVLARMDAERDARRRALIFGFPQQLAAFRPLAERFITGVFSGTSFDGRSLLRGTYLTSGTQVGSPIDRLIGAVARSFGLDAPALPRAAATGRAYFIERLFRGVMFVESGLAGLDRKLDLRKTLLQTALYAGLAAVTLLGVAALWVSYSRNAAYLDEVAAAQQRYDDAVKAEAADSAASLEGALPRLDALSAVVQIARRHDADGAPLSMRWGLYQGRAMAAAADDAYHRELNTRLLPVLAARFRGWLERFSAHPLLLYDALRIYLMLGETDRLEPAPVTSVAKAELAREFAADRATRDALSVHVEQLFADRKRLRGTPLDAQAVERARAALQLASVPALIYGRIQAAYRDETERALSLERSVPNLDLAFVRASRKPWSEPLPALYTADVFQEVSRLGAAGVIARFAPEGWVLGEEGAGAPAERAREAYTAMQLYEQDYIRAWSELLADVRINTGADFKQVLYVLGSQTSPLKGLLSELRKQTDLLAASSAAGKAADAAAEAAKKKLEANPLAKGLLGAAKAEGLTAPEQDGALVTRHFLPLHRLTQGPAGAQPIDRVIQLLGQAHQQLAATGGSFGQASTIDALGSGRGSVFQQLELEARQLPAPVDKIVAAASGSGSQLALGQAKGEVSQRLKEQLQPECQVIVGSGYPFKPGASADVPPGDFGRLFGTGGLLDAFFSQTLAPMVDRSSRPWTMRPGAVAIAPDLLKTFEQADRIRMQYFKPGAAEPELRFTLLPQSLDGEVARFVLEIGAKRYEYRHDAPQPWPIVWPGEDSSLAAITFEEMSGGAPFLKFEGPWALFRLIEAGRLDPRSGTDYALTWQAGGRSIKFKLTAASINNPFRSLGELSRFRCPG